MAAELLEALRNLLDAYDGRDRFTDEARAAIAKAEGEETNPAKERDCLASVDSGHLLQAVKKALVYLEGVEGEFNVILDSAEACRNAIAKAEGKQS